MSRKVSRCYARCSTLHVRRFTLHARRFTLHARRGEEQGRSHQAQRDNPVRASRCSSLRSLQSPVFSLQSSVLSLQSPVLSSQFSVSSLQFSVFSLHRTANCALPTAYSYYLIPNTHYHFPPISYIFRLHKHPTDGAVFAERHKKLLKTKTTNRCT